MTDLDQTDMLKVWDAPLFGTAIIILSAILILRTEPTAFTPHMRDATHEQLKDKD